MAFEKENKFSGDLIAFQRNRLEQIGAPVDYILFDDLKKRDHNYKLYIFLNCFQYDDKILAAVEKEIKSKDVTALWCYAPGFIYGARAEVKNMEKLTGMIFGMTEKPASPIIDIIDFA